MHDVGIRRDEVMVIDRDLARGVRAERLTRIYATLAKADEAIVRIRQRLPLFEEVCRVLVEDGRLRMVWVGEIDDHGWVVPVAHAGAALRYLDDIRVSVLDVAEGRGPTGIAARERHHASTTDVATDARMALWRDAALMVGFRSSAALPLVVEDRCVAVLTAYASEPGFFDEEEVALLDRVAVDLSFALGAMQRDERHREVEAQLRASEERYRRALSALSEGIVVQGNDGEITSCNPAAERILGLSVDQMTGVRSTDPLWRAVHEDGSPFPGEEHPAMVTLRTGAPQENVIMGVHKPDGSLSWISINSVAFPDVGDSGAGAVVTSFADITARRDAEARLREDEERLNAAIGSMRDAVAILSPVRDESGEIIDFRYDYANEAHCELVGRDREHLLTRQVDEVHPGWARSERFELYRQVILTGEPCRSEDFHPEQTWGTVFARREIDNFVVRAGEQVVVSARDVTDRRRAEAQLRASEERFDAAVGSMLDAFTIISPVRDGDGGIVDFRWEYVNDAYCQLVGFDRGQLVGHRLVELLPGFPASARFALYRGVVETGEPCLSVDVAEPEAWVGGRVASQVLDTMIVAAGENVVVTARDVTERHRLEEQLRASEERFRGGFEHSPIGMTLTNLDGTWERVNAAFARMLGYEDPQELAGVNFVSLTHPDNVDVDLDGFRGMLEHDRPYTAQKRYLRRDGEVVTVILAATAVRDEQGHPVALFTQAEDITERERAERERVQALAELEEAQHIAQLGSWRWDPSAGTRVWSAGMYLVYGCDPAAGPMDTTQSFAFVHPDDLERVQGAYARIRQRGAGFELDYRLVTADGETRPVHAIARPDPGEPGCYRGTLQDITDRINAERELALRAQLLDLVHDAVIVRDPVEGRVTFWNSEAGAVYGYGSDEAVGRVTHDLLGTVFPESRQAVDDALNRDGHWVGELRHTRKDGAVMVVSSRQALQRDSDGRPIAIIELNSDITARRDAERRIQELNQTLRRSASDLEVANHELEGFAYSVAHDLRSPLRAVAGFIVLLSDGGHIAPDDQPGRALVNRVTAAAARMAELIDALLELAQLSRQALHIARIDLSMIATELADELRAGGEPRQVQFVIAPGLDADADPRLARVLLRCLLENAWKYSAGREPARIELARAAGGFMVCDNGAGFDMEFADLLFKPFGRLHRQDEFPGTGVGLATAERIVRRHGGAIRGESRVGHGATFFFSFQPTEDPRP